MFYTAATGTHRGPFMGMAPTGKTFKVNGVDVFRFNDEGKIAVHWGVFDTWRSSASFLRRDSIEAKGQCRRLRR